MSNITSIKSVFFALLMALFMLVAAAPATHAQTLTYPAHNVNTVDEFIVYLQQLLAQLQQIKQQQAYSYQYQYQVQPPYYYQPTGQVRGVSYSTGRLDVDTIGVANTDDDETTMYADVDLNGASYATVWFEYGEDGDLDERTRSVRVDRTVSDRVGIRVTNLDEDERYSFRAVATDPSGYRDRGEVKWFQLEGYDKRSRRSSNDDEPDATTDDAEDIEEDEAELHGEVDMNDFDNGYVFFVYGEDEDQVEDVEDEDEYRDIDEDGEDLQKVVVDSDLDGRRNYWRRVTGLDENTDHYFRICVEYEDEDDDETLECGDVEEFETD